MTQKGMASSGVGVDVGATAQVLLAPGGTWNRWNSAFVKLCREASPEYVSAVLTRTLRARTSVTHVRFALLAAEGLDVRGSRARERLAGAILRASVLLRSCRHQATTPAVCAGIRKCAMLRGVRALSSFGPFYEASSSPMVRLCAALTVESVLFSAPPPMHLRGLARISRKVDAMLALAAPKWNRTPHFGALFSAAFIADALLLRTEALEHVMKSAALHGKLLCDEILRSLRVIHGAWIKNVQADDPRLLVLAEVVEMLRQRSEALDS